MSTGAGSQGDAGSISSGTGSSIEFVDGDRLRKRRFLLLSLLSLALLSAIAVLFFVALIIDIGWVGDSGGEQSILIVATRNYWLFPSLFLAPTLLDLGYTHRLPHLRPGSVRIGYSSRGLTVQFPLATRTFAWSDVRWRDESHCELHWRLGTSRLTLTPDQATAIHRFFHPPLTGSGN